jgi:uncharacterized membrane protein AbrB (regulator of aidB expression)
MTNVTKTTTAEKAYLVGQALISATIIYTAWGYDSPIADFALTFGGMLLGHIITEAFNQTEGEEE